MSAAPSVPPWFCAISTISFAFSGSRDIAASTLNGCSTLLIDYPSLMRG